MILYGAQLCPVGLGKVPVRADLGYVGFKQAARDLYLNHL